MTQSDSMDSGTHVSLNYVCSDIEIFMDNWILIIGIGNLGNGRGFESPMRARFTCMYIFM